jgi:hypothetical protein
VIDGIPTKIKNCGSDVGRAAVEKPSSDELESIIKACGVEEIGININPPSNPRRKAAEHRTRPYCV